MLLKFVELLVNDLETLLKAVCETMFIEELLTIFGIDWDTTELASLSIEETDDNGEANFSTLVIPLMELLV